MNNESRVTQPLLFVEEFESRVEYVGLDDCMAPADTVPSAAPRSQDVQKLKQRNWSVVAKVNRRDFPKSSNTRGTSLRYLHRITPPLLLKAVLFVFRDGMQI
jgi:hypothetical protein